MVPSYAMHVPAEATQHPGQCFLTKVACHCGALLLCWVGEDGHRWAVCALSEISAASTQVSGPLPRLNKTVRRKHQEVQFDLLLLESAPIPVRNALHLAVLAECYKTAVKLCWIRCRLIYKVQFTLPCHNVLQFHSKGTGLLLL